MSYAKAVARQTFSTKQFVPGHVAGAAMILFGTIAITKALVARHKEQLREDLAKTRRSGTTSVAVAENSRGEYGDAP